MNRSREVVVTDRKKRDLAVLAAVAAGYGALFLLGVTCPIKFLTGLSCPGCGMTRAWLALLAGKPALALRCHPLVWLPPIALALYLFRAKLPPSVVRGGAAAFCGALFAVYLFRLLSGCAPQVVAWAPKEGLILRAVAGMLRAIP